MNINFELYRVFYAVATAGNISRAAKQLHISQPAVSKAIKKLEEQLGGPLLIRTKKGVTLTSEGEVFFLYVKQAIENFYAAEDKFSDLINLETGTVRIGSSMNVAKEILLPYLSTFHRKYPKINIQLIIDHSAELIEKLKNGLLDVILMNHPTYTDNDMNITKLQRVHDCWIASKKHYPHLYGRPVPLTEMYQYPILVPTARALWQMMYDLFKNAGIDFKPTMQLDNFDLCYEFTKYGFGISYSIKEFIIDRYENDDVFILDTPSIAPFRYICLATSKRHLLGFSTKKLIDVILENHGNNE